MSFTNTQIHDFSLPHIDDVKFISISKDYYKIITLKLTGFYIVLIAGLFVLKSFAAIEELQNNFWFVFVIAILICSINFIISIKALQKRKYAVREHDLIYSKGLFINSITTVPISRIQHIEESRTWLDRQFHLSTLNIFTAGESGSDLSINGLPMKEAKEINDFISLKVNGKDGLFTAE